MLLLVLKLHTTKLCPLYLVIFKCSDLACINFSEFPNIHVICLINGHEIYIFTV